MAAFATPQLRVVELRHVRTAQIETLLAEESQVWDREFAWDFRPTAELVRRFLNMQALAGHALMSGGDVVGYAYYVAEDRKGLIGDLFLRGPWRQPGHASLLLDAAVEELSHTSGVRRVESQLMMVAPTDPVRIPMPNRARAYSRDFFRLDLRHAPVLKMHPTVARFEHWRDRWIEDAAQLVPAAYRGHVDSDINDQYRTVNGARRFINNIVQYPGCGTFFQPGSWVAYDASGNLLGLCLASLVAHDAGHLTQLAVAPSAQRTGLGYELVRRSIGALQKSGCRTVSLTVTSSNREAVGLYDRMGFDRTRRFRAIVWDL